MATYKYKLRTAANEIKQGFVQANTQSEALLRVHKLGGTPIEVNEMKPGGFKLPFLKPKLSLKERIIFSEQLAVMLKAGITLVQALKGLEEESSNKALKAVLQEMIADLEGGLQFSEALAKHPKIFSRIYCQMVKSAEKTGNVADVLNKLTVQQQKEYELKGKVRGAMIYPAIVSVLMVGVMILVITFIIPKLSGMFTESGADLPMSTKMLLALSDFMTKQWYILIGIVVACVVGFRFGVNTKKGRYFYDAFILRVPVVGNLMRKTYLARFTQSFASLSQAGVPVLDIFKTLQGVMGNVIYEDEIIKIANDIENGVKVSLAIRKSKHFPGMVGQLVSVGEQSGDLAGVFAVLGDFFEKEVDGMTRNLSTMLEPIIMIVMGLGVGFILISVLQPIYSLTNNI
jgi:type IV pilus assembly protein PilC